MFRLDAAVQHYAWGSPEAIPSFLGEPSDGRPVAELWFGTHPLGPSLLVTDDGSRPLVEAAGELPFMLKVLAPAEPLSIQVHPSRARAAEGFAAEESAGIALTDPTRDYKDPHDKPEMVYALTEFETLVGFRPVEEAVRLLKGIDAPLARALLARADQSPVAMTEFVLSGQVTAADVDAFVAGCSAALAAGDDVARGCQTVVEVARFHPSDPGLAVALLLNRVTLQPGEAAFIGPGLIHAHLTGLCLEVMVSSDNVLRAGLTPKRVNVPGLVSSLNASDGADARVAPVRVGDATDVFDPGGSGLFALSVSQGAEGRLPGAGPRILLCLDGDVEVVAESGDVVPLAQGQAAFAADADGALSLRGSGTAAQAYVP